MKNIEQLSKETIGVIVNKLGKGQKDDMGLIGDIEGIIKEYNEKVEEIKLLESRPFKVGDVITGKPESNDMYGFTTEDAIMIVREVKTYCESIEVEILQHNNPDVSLDRGYVVLEHYFRKVI